MFRIKRVKSKVACGANENEDAGDDTESTKKKASSLKNGLTASWSNWSKMVRKLENSGGGVTNRLNFDSILRNGNGNGYGGCDNGKGRRYSFAAPQHTTLGDDKYDDDGDDGWAIASPLAANLERRASYDVSSVKWNSPSSSVADADAAANDTDTYKSTRRRDSLIRRWFERLSNSAEAHKTKDHKQKSSDRSSDVSILDHCENDAESSAKTKENESNDSSETVSSTTPSANVRHPQDELTHRTSIDAVSKKTDSTSPSSHKKQPLLTVEPPPRITTEVPLIEPSQVLISQSPVLTAEPVLTPLERLRRKDEVIREALKEKQKLVADILHVSTTKSGGSGGGGGECEAVTNFQSEVTYDKEASELVLAAVSQADQLTGILNECLRVSEEDVIIAGSETTSKMSSNATIATTATATTTTTTTTSSGGGSMRLLPSLQVPKLQSITHSLSAHLTQLLNITIERDEEREKLRQELQKSREQLHAVYETQLRSQQRLGDQLPSPDQPTRNSTNDNQLDVTSKTSANDCSSAKK